METGKPVLRVQSPAGWKASDRTLLGTSLLEPTCTAEQPRGLHPLQTSGIFPCLPDPRGSCIIPIPQGKETKEVLRNQIGRNRSQRRSQGMLGHEKGGPQKKAMN